ncbi:X-Pro dipeptidyl-peptidase family protein [Sphingopyxis sp. LC81]|uniref:alpha/beta hydrolase family protein n=1 Tax=Sphingopyxis sp. LC81 TaxID=1502850 RepID=UPI00050FC7C2|nr:alpha/beta hydrolase [Sphingopyxis sp. LC81]KGB55708.1 X-Pro dipeptidyl-peptidase family protein [Sphingopyxis sp. LC81]
MKHLIGTLFLLATLPAAPAFAQTACAPGTYAAPDGDFVVLVKSPAVAAPGLRYMFRDGRRGATTDAGVPLTCGTGDVAIGGKRWAPIAFRETPATFDSVGTKMTGVLIEPPGNDAKRPLVVMVHGSERTSPIGGIYGYAMAAQGISVFVYDKRGTGGSEGEYTQNFELLAEDAASALGQARGMAAGRYGRAGFFGGSQGGWVAPLAATRTKADFVAIGFGLVASPIEEDREQMVSEVRAAGLGRDAEALVGRLSDATGKLLLSGFADGYTELDAARAEMAGQPWAAKIAGEHSGAIARMSNDELRRVGRARFDNLELIWNYDAFAALKKLDAPLLWVLAGEDREAPIETTRGALLGLAKAGKPVDVYLFPQTDHGMWEFTTDASGERQVTRITDGYLKLLADWIKRDARGAYGRAERLTPR